MKYAPVLIATVNRYEHFRACLESLSRCTWADKTDVFVAVDYPGKEEHWEGYNQIKEYLYNCGSLGFKTLNLQYRETNYYFSGKGNLETLMKEVLVDYDRIIVTEDDNVFSPNFLVFMDKGLEKFEDDSSVFALNGYSHFYPIHFEKNTFFRQNVDFSAWGWGAWRDRVLMMNSMPVSYFQNKLNWKSFRKLRKNGRIRLIHFLRSCTWKKVVLTDNALSVMLPLEDMDVIMPKISLVRNIGWDGSGIHCNDFDKDLIQMHVTQPISEENDFDFIGTGFEHYEENKKVFVDSAYIKASIFDLTKEIIRYFIKRSYSLIKK